MALPLGTDDPSWLGGYGHIDNVSGIRVGPPPELKNTSCARVIVVHTRDELEILRISIEERGNCVAATRRVVGTDHGDQRR